MEENYLPFLLDDELISPAIDGHQVDLLQHTSSIDPPFHLDHEGFVDTTTPVNDGENVATENIGSAYPIDPQLLATIHEPHDNNVNSSSESDSRLYTMQSS